MQTKATTPYHACLSQIEQMLSVMHTIGSKARHVQGGLYSGNHFGICAGVSGANINTPTQSLISCELTKEANMNPLIRVYKRPSKSPWQDHHTLMLLAETSVKTVLYLYLDDISVFCEIFSDDFEQVFSLPPSIYIEAAENLLTEAILQLEC